MAVVLDYVLENSESFSTHHALKNTYHTSNISAFNWWGTIIGFILSTGNRFYVGWFGTFMFPLSGLAIIGYMTAFILAPPVDIDGIREPVSLDTNLKANFKYVKSRLVASRV